MTCKVGSIYPVTSQAAIQIGFVIDVVFGAFIVFFSYRTTFTKKNQQSASLCHVNWGITFVIYLVVFLHFDSSCTFGSKRCGNGTIQQTLTDLGVCYTFNSDPKNQLVSFASGRSSCLLMAFH